MASRERWWFGAFERALIGGREGQQGEQGQSRRGRPEAQTTNTIGMVRVYGIGLLAIHAASFSQRMIRSPLVTSAGSTPAILGKYFTLKGADNPGVRAWTQRLNTGRVRSHRCAGCGVRGLEGVVELRALRTHRASDGFSGVWRFHSLCRSLGPNPARTPRCALRDTVLPTGKPCSPSSWFRNCEGLDPYAAHRWRADRGWPIIALPPG